MVEWREETMGSLRLDVSILYTKIQCGLVMNPAEWLVADRG